MDLMRLNGLLRRAIPLVKGIDIRVSEQAFEFAMTSVVPGFKVQCMHAERMWTKATCAASASNSPKRDM